MTHTRPRTNRLRPLSILLGLLLVATTATAGQRFHYLAQELGFDGVVPEDVAPKIDPTLLQKLEADAEEAYFKSATIGTERSIIVSLRDDRGRRAEVLTEKNGAGREALQQRVRDAQDRVLQAVATKSRQGFRLRNRYTTLAGFSAYADFHGIAALAQHDDVAWVEEMQVFHTQAMLDHRAGELSRVDDVHSVGDYGNGVTIAVIDSGIDHDHDLFGGWGAFPNQKIIGGYDFGDDDAHPGIDCTSDEHGTATAFIAAGAGGVASLANLVHLKVQSASKCGQSTLNGDIPGAIDWVVTNQALYGIDIISMSLGSGTHSSPCSSGSTSGYRNALDDAEAAGIMVFAASGNDGEKSKISFPACYPSVVSVGAVYDRNYKNTKWTYYNNDGSTLCSDNKPDKREVTCYSNSADFLDLLAFATCAKVAKAGGGTDGCFSGTSAATPMAAGIAALLMERDPTRSKDEIKLAMTTFGNQRTDPENGITTPLVDALLSWAFLPTIPNLP